MSLPDQLQRLERVSFLSLPARLFLLSFNGFQCTAGGIFYFFRINAVAKNDFDSAISERSCIASGNPINTKAIQIFSCRSICNCEAIAVFFSAIILARSPSILKISCFFERSSMKTISAVFSKPLSKEILLMPKFRRMLSNAVTVYFYWSFYSFGFPQIGMLFSDST